MTKVMWFSSSALSLDSDISDLDIYFELQLLFGIR